MTAATNVMAYLTNIPIKGQYRLGTSLLESPDDIWINTTDEDGTRIICAEPPGWEGVEFVTPIDTVGGRDGGLIGPQSVAPRVLEVSGAMVATNGVTLRQKIRKLRAQLGPRKVVVWDQYDFGIGERMALVCRATGDFKATPLQGDDYGGVATTFIFTLTASTPWKYSTGAVTPVCVGLPTNIVTGRTYNKTYNWNYGSTANPGGILNFTNRGDVVSWPVFTITGPVDMPIITNETTGQAFIISGDIPAGVTVTIDSRTGVVSPSNYRLIGRPWSLAPGVNTVRWRANSGSYTADALLCLTARHTWE